MRAQPSPALAGEAIFVGIDMHKRQWHVTARTADVELFSASIPGTWDALLLILGRYHGHPITAAYEAGGFGFWLHDRLVDPGAKCLVTPPSLLPQESGNRVKTDRRDSRKLAFLLSKGILKRVWVPSQRERADQLAAYVGLTPSQYSSADKVRMGRITASGKNSLRGALVEAAWVLISKDGAMRVKYKRPKARAGAKRAIVAVARLLLLRTRRMLLDGRPYGLGVAG